MPWTDRRNLDATKPYEAETRRATRWPNNDEVGADGIGEANGASNAVRGSSGSGVQRNDASSTGAVQAADEKPPGAPDVEMGAGDSFEAQVKRAKTIKGLDMCVLEAQDDVYDETLETPTNLAETTGENATDEDAAAPEVTEELNRLNTLAQLTKPRASMN